MQLLPSPADPGFFGTVASPDHCCARAGNEEALSHAFHAVVADRHPNPHHPPARALHPSFLEDLTSPMIARPLGLIRSF